MRSSALIASSRLPRRRRTVASSATSRPGLVAAEGLLDVVQPLGHRPEPVVELRPHHPLHAGQPGAEGLLQQLDPALQLAVGAELAGELAQPLGHQALERLQLPLDLGEGLPLGPLLGQLGDHRPAEQLVDPRHALRQVGVLWARHRPSVSARVACTVANAAPMGTIVALAGGVGAARFLRGLVRAMPAEDVVVVGNTGDDEVFHGLHVSPDLDTVTYTLAGAVGAAGWGLADDTFRTLEAYERYGEPTWFRLGDADLATHLYRTTRLREGATLTEVTAEIALAWGVKARLLPMSDDRVATVIDVAAGDDGSAPVSMAMQEWFVRERAQPPVAGVRFEGAAAARPGPAVLDALAEADAILLCPSNPVISIGPILALPGVRDALRARRAPGGGGEPDHPGRDREGPGRPADGGRRASRSPAPAWPPSTPTSAARCWSTRATPTGSRDVEAHGVRAAVAPILMRDADGAADAGPPGARPGLLTEPDVIELIPLPGLPEIRPGMVLAPLLVEAARPPPAGRSPAGDCLVVTQKVVSKAEGRLVPLDPADLDARRRLVEAESVRILRRRGDLIISETRHGFVCANAGVDLSNVDDGLGGPAAGGRRPLGPAHPGRDPGRRPGWRWRW